MSFPYCWTWTWKSNWIIISGSVLAMKSTSLKYLVFLLYTPSVICERKCSLSFSYSVTIKINAWARMKSTSWWANFVAPLRWLCKSKSSSFWISFKALMNSCWNARAFWALKIKQTSLPRKNLQKLCPKCWLNSTAVLLVWKARLTSSLSKLDNLGLLTICK